MDKIVIGLDIGGTTVKIGFLAEDGEIVKKWKIPTNKKNQGKFIVEEIWQSVLKNLPSLNLDQQSIFSIVAGAPGFVDKKSGVIYEAVNIGWKNYDLAGQLKAVADVPVFIENDANLAALGENWKGAGAGSRNMIAITLGTGVGGGIIANGEILSGVNGTGGEIGHIKAESDGASCNCGRKGCLETIVSATGLVRQAVELINDNPSSNLSDLYHKNGEISAKDIFSLAGKGDILSRQIINRNTDILGSVLASLSVIVNPSIITIGGGLSQAGEPFINAIADSFRRQAMPRVSEVCSIKEAELGNDAALIGAARVNNEFEKIHL
ncbi:ROK family glucokinase [Virgibacillus oceani]